MFPAIGGSPYTVTHKYPWWIKQAIMEKQLPDAELAEMLGITRKRVVALRSEWKVGRNPSPASKPFDLVDTEEL